jgi:pheromone shutdown protein TraB
MHHGENVLMILDQDSNEVISVELDVPRYRNILSKSRTQFIFFNSKGLAIIVTV